MKFIKFYNDGANGTVISELAQKFNVDEKVMEIIYSKGYKTEEDVSIFLNAQNQPFVDPFKLSGMKECIEKIKVAVVYGMPSLEKILSKKENYQFIEEIFIGADKNE